MKSTLYILGRQPAIGIAELESLYGEKALNIVGDIAVHVSTEDVLPFARIGGSIKQCEILAELTANDWKAVDTAINIQLPSLLTSLPEGKIKFGMSVYGVNVSPSKIQATALGLKKTVKQSGRSIRIIPNKAPELNAAQVLRNKLTDELGFELNIIVHEQSVIFARTLAVQDIDAYAARDHGRPMRDSKVGMLPPKLAQIIINLSTGRITPGTNTQQRTVLDPFCGTGVVLQEALLAGYNATGSDLEPRMVEYSERNLEWLNDNASYAGTSMIFEADATNADWESIDHIASETYLGRPFSALPPAEVLQGVMHDVDTIHRKFLENVTRQTNPGFRMCVAVPAWKTKNGFLHLETLDSLEELGYNRLRFVHTDNQELIYHRPGQIVGRELVTLIRK